MPNLCYNRLIVMGKSVRKFNSLFKGRNKKPKGIKQSNYSYSLNNLLPKPENLDYESEWARRNWGCSRDIYCDVISKKLTKKFYYYKFITSWNTPFTWLVKVSKLFPHTKFIMEYAIPMTGYAGEYRFESGNLIYENIDENYNLKHRLKRINSTINHKMLRSAIE